MKGKGLVLSLGLILGVFLIFFANASLAYTDTPQFCGMCHIMEEFRDVHLESIHQNLTCNDCHAPKSLVPKLMFKAKAGAGHMYVTTLGTIPDVFKAVEASQEVVAKNCLRCHAATVEKTHKDNDERRCVSCHVDQIHGVN